MGSLQNVSIATPFLAFRRSRIQLETIDTMARWTLMVLAAHFAHRYHDTWSLRP